MRHTRAFCSVIAWHAFGHFLLVLEGKKWYLPKCQTDLLDLYWACVQFLMVQLHWSNMLHPSLFWSINLPHSFLSFPREHFPFFQTAPEGWKNTIRHNLCFNNSFRKTCNQLLKDGKRKSCFWHLTLDGQRRLKDEICTLTEESFKQLERSMSNPGDCDKTLIWGNELNTVILLYWPD